MILGIRYDVTFCLIFEPVVSVNYRIIIAVDSVKNIKFALQ